MTDQIRIVRPGYTGDSTDSGAGDLLDVGDDVTQAEADAMLASGMASTPTVTSTPNDPEVVMAADAAARRQDLVSVEVLTGFSVGAAADLNPGDVVSVASDIARRWIEVGRARAAIIVTVAANEGGTVDPSGSVGVAFRGDLEITATPDEGFAIEDFQVDGESVEPDDGVYTLEDVTAPHAVQVTFAEEE